ncbi:MAG: diguanylate cyclase, partial [Treponema sp.]|nr:diguanylate cyclase [Treponema sp.]
TVFTAKSGEEVAERVKDNLPDLILLDIMLPGIDGFEVLRRLKEAPETMGIPVMFISGLTSEANEEKGLLMGAVDYICKPFNTAIVMARVKTHIQIVHQMRTIERLGLVDPLTDIPNRRCFDDRILVEWRRAQRAGSSISLLTLDVDKFKDYNDTWGHPQGDVLLKTVSHIFTLATRRPGDISARVGGEEFCILLSDTNLEAALKIAEDIRSQIEQLIIPTPDRAVTTRVTISIGVASCVPDKNVDVADFVSDSDKNLYKAKQQGRNRVCY